MQRNYLMILLAATVTFGAPQYSGSAFTTTFATDGVKQDLINSIETALLNGTSGWTTVSGHGTTNLLMQSGTTSAGSLQINARFRDNSGNGIQVYLENTSGTLKPSSYATSNGCTLLPTSGITYTVIASKYQFLIFNASSPTTSREFCWVGMPYLTSDLASNITTAGFLFGNTGNDGDTTWRDAITGCTDVAASGCSGQGNGNYELMINSTWWESANNAGQSSNGVIGAPRLFGLMAMTQSITGINTTQLQWNTSPLSYITSDVYIGWGTAGTTAAAVIQGQIYDCVYITVAQPIGTTATWSSHNWYEMTNSYTGSNQQLPPGGFWFVTQ